jgi:hypothetical protein
MRIALMQHQIASSDKTSSSLCSTVVHRAIMRYLPRLASLTSQRRRAAPPALSVEDAACPYHDKASPPHHYSEIVT